MEPEPGVKETPDVPAELTGPLPRRTRLSEAGVNMIKFASVFLLLAAVGSLWVYYTVRMRQEVAALRRSGRETTGEMKQVWFPGGAQVPWVSYAFAVKGETFDGEARVPEQLLHNVEDSKTLPVRYLPGNPAVNHPAAWKGSMPLDRKAFLIPIGILAMLGAGLLLSMPRERRLLAEGVPVLAVVTHCNGAGNGGHLVKYTFRVGEGPYREGKGLLKNPQEIGAKIWVLYLARHPRVNCQYPVSDYRLDRP